MCQTFFEMSFNPFKNSVKYGCRYQSPSRDKEMEENSTYGHPPGSQAQVFWLCVICVRRRQKDTRQKTISQVHMGTNGGLGYQRVGWDGGLSYLQVPTLAEELSVEQLC